MAKEQVHPNSAAASARKALQEAGVTLQISGTNLQERLEKRQLQQQLRLQSNLESILRDALKNCSSAASDHPLDADWLDAFLSLAERTSNPDMQKLWALIFAKEASVRGSFSIRSLKLLSELTRKDAEMFQRAVALSCLTPGDSSRKILFGCYYPSGWGLFTSTEQHKLSLYQFALPYSSLLWLMEHGLVHSAELETSSLSKDQDYQIKTGKKALTFKPKVAGIKLRYYRFTPVGDELARLVSGLEHPDYQASLASMLSHAMTPVK